MTIVTSLAVLGALLPPTAADPCSALPAERVAAVFAAAGEPVTGDETFGFGDVRQQGYCRYAFTDRNGIGISLEVNIAQLSAGEHFTSCQPDGVGELRMVPGLADEACTWDGGSALPLFAVILSFRSGDRIGKVMLEWSRSERMPVVEKRRDVAERVARVWIEQITAPRSPGDAAVDESVMLRITHYVSARMASFGVPGSRQVFVQRDGESVAAWAQRLDAASGIKAALAEHGFTPREYLDFGLRFHDAWMAYKGRPTGTAPDPTMLATVRAGGRHLDALVDSSWPGIVH